MQTGQNGTINRIAKQYYKVSLWIIFGLTVIILLVMQYLQSTSLVNALVISALFSLVSSIAYIQSWKSVARRAPKTLGKFYLAASALRMLAALLTVVVAMFILRGEKGAMIGFAAMFVGFYIVMLVFDCIYFAQIEKKNNIM